MNSEKMKIGKIPEQGETRRERSGKSREPILITTVDMGNDKGIELAIYEGDDPMAVVHRFCKKNRLSARIQEGLVLHVLESLERSQISLTKDSDDGYSTDGSCNNYDDENDMDDDIEDGQNHISYEERQGIGKVQVGVVLIVREKLTTGSNRNLKRKPAWKLYAFGIHSF